MDNIEKIYFDDPIKILRTIRKSVELGWKIEKKTWVSMILCSKYILNASQERVTDEINKMLLCDTPGEAMLKLDRCNVLHRIIPSLAESKHVYQDLRPKRTLFDHTLEVMDKTPKRLETRLAALFHDIGKITTYNKNFMFHQSIGADNAEEIMKLMKYSNATIAKVKLAIENHESFSSYMGNSVPRPTVIRKFISKFDGDEDALEIALDLIHANNISQMYGKKIKQVPGIREKIKELDAKNESCKKIKLPIDGSMLMQEFNLKPTKLLGTLILQVKNAVIENPKLTKEEAFKVVENYLKKVV